VLAAAAEYLDEARLDHVGEIPGLTLPEKNLAGFELAMIFVDLHRYGLPPGHE